MPAGDVRVGVVGAGAATQAIHLPTLARFPGVFRVTAVVDVDHDLAGRVAEGAGARVTGSLDEMLAGGVDVVVICSPNRFHADQVVASCRAGVSAVLCEKPLATSTSEAELVARTSRETGVPVVVGTMHGFDPAWRAASKAWLASGSPAHTVRIASLIPPNPRTEDFATEMIRPPDPRSPSPSGGPDGLPPRLPAEIERLRGGVLGLAIHDLPLARELLPDASPTVLAVRSLAPSGYLIVADVGGAVLELRGGSSRNWLPDWELQAIADDRVLGIDFGPSYVHAGSAVAQISARHETVGFETTGFGPALNDGYLAQWHAIARMVGGRERGPDLETLVADLDFAVQLADQCAGQLRANASSGAPEVRP